MKDYIWLLDKEKSSERAWAIAGSALTHAALFAALTFADVNYPLAGDSGLKIVWLDLAPSSPDAGTPSQLTRGAGDGIQEVASAAPAKSASLTLPGRSDAHEQKAPAFPVHAPEAELEASATSADEKSAAGWHDIPEDSNQVLVVGQAQQKISAKEKLPADSFYETSPTERISLPDEKRSVNEGTKPKVVSAAQHEQVQPKERYFTSYSSMMKNDVPAKVQERRDTGQKAELAAMKEVSADRASIKSSEDLRVPNTLPSLHTPSKQVAVESTKRLGDSRQVANQNVSMQEKRKSLSQVSMKEKSESLSLLVAKAENGKGVVPSVKGDLKMVITADTGARLNVSFRAFPKARRAKAQTRIEAQRKTSVVPVMLRPTPHVVEAVIESAEEGVYVFSVTPGDGDSVTSTFSFRLFEGGVRERAVKLGTRTIQKEVVIVKVLMPDGVLWDDDTAFTGSIQDSESTTKFNTSTGLCWKEYNN